MTVNNDFPKPIIEIIEALDSDKRRRILIELEDKILTHGNLLESQGLLNNDLNFHLKKLTSAGMIRCFLKGDGCDFLHYEITNLGRDSINGLFSAFEVNLS